jgi:hypothetical protein
MKTVKVKIIESEWYPVFTLNDDEDAPDDPIDGIEIDVSEERLNLWIILFAMFIRLQKDIFSCCEEAKKAKAKKTRKPNKSKRDKK